jgi:hypothetical protein
MQNHHDDTRHLRWTTIIGLLFFLVVHLFFIVIMVLAIVGHPAITVWPSTPRALLWGIAVYAAAASAILIRQFTHIATRISFTPLGFEATRFGVWCRFVRSEDVISVKHIPGRWGADARFIVRFRGGWLDIRRGWYQDDLELVERFSSLANKAERQPPPVGSED